MPILDMAKAFDSVSFPTLRITLRAKGIPKQMEDYIMNIYECSTTIVGWILSDSHPPCGVKEGDILSPFQFNMVMDGMLRSLTPEIGVDVDGYRMNVLAFADDLVLLALTATGLQSLLNFLHACRLEANVGNCATISIKSIPKVKKTAVDVSCRFEIRGFTIPTLKRTDEWRYLGITFNAEGRI